MPIENCSYCDNEFEAEGDEICCSDECKDLSAAEGDHVLEDALEREREERMLDEVEEEDE